jgi:amino acid transporter
MFNVINVLFVTGWCFALSYSIAVPLNKFLAAWFVAQGALSLYGFLGGAIFDGKAITVAQLIGALLVSLGSYLLIK